MWDSAHSWGHSSDLDKCSKNKGETVKTDDYSQRNGFHVMTGTLALPKVKGENVWD